MSESDGIHGEITLRVTNGEYDPLIIARKIIKEKGQFWVAEQLLAIAEEVFAGMAREEINRIRRSKEIVLRSDDAVATAQIKKARAWVPGKGYVLYDEITIEDAEAKCRWYEAGSRIYLRRATYWGEIHDLMVTHEQYTISELTKVVNLPAVPEDLEIDVPEIMLKPRKALVRG